MVRKQEIFDAITKTSNERVMIIDGAMGTMIQREHLSEEDYRGEILKVYCLYKSFSPILSFFNI